MVNPNIGASVDIEYLKREYQKADHDGEASMRGFAAKHLNVEIGVALQTDNWAGAEFWESAARDVKTLDDIVWVAHNLHFLSCTRPSLQNTG